jgi:outer membrane protein assembly factor BamB
MTIQGSLAMAVALALAACGGGVRETHVVAAAVQDGEEDLGRRPHVRTSGPDGAWLEAGATEEPGRPWGAHVTLRDRAGRALWRRDLFASEPVTITSLALGRGACFVGGWFGGTLGLEPGGDANPLAARKVEMFLAAFAPDGALRWLVASRSATAEGFATCEVIAALADGSCIVAGKAEGMVAFPSGRAIGPSVEGRARERGFVARYAADGELRWVRPVEGRLDAESVAVLATSTLGAFVLAGEALPSEDLGAGSGRGAFVAAFGEDGVPRWRRHASSDGHVMPRAAAIGPDGSHVLTGAFTGSARFEGRADALATRTLSSMGLFVARYDASGDLRWLRTGGGEGDDYARGEEVRVAADGTIEVRGSFSGGLALGATPLQAAPPGEGFLAAFDAEGIVVRAHLEPRPAR